MTGLSLITEDVLLFDCERCDATGLVPQYRTGRPVECFACEGLGYRDFARSIATLIHNVAIAVALAAMEHSQ